VRHDAQVEGRSPGRDAALVRSAWHVSALSATWTILTSSIAVGLGVTQGSVTLVAFGAVGYLDALGSVVLVIHFLSHARRLALAERAERWAHWIIGSGLVAVGVAAVVVSAIRLLGDQNADGSVAGVVLAALSVVTLALLSYRKQKIARRIDSTALLADGRLSGVGAMQAGVVLAGTLVTTQLGWSWVDPVAASAVGLFAIVLGYGTLRDARRAVSR
jgi:divalent metal cation (Fe/Co/Zn/Cd) transporter